MPSWLSVLPLAVDVGVGPHPSTVRGEGFGDRPLVLDDRAHEASYQHRIAAHSHELVTLVSSQHLR